MADRCPPKVDKEKAELLVTWTRRKICVHCLSTELYFDEREVWWVSLGENVGSEANGKHESFERPIIVLRKLSANMLIAVPVTTKMKVGSWYHHFHLGDEERCAILSQIRVISSLRLIRRIDSITPAEFVKLQNATIGLIKKTDPPACAGGSSDPLARTM